MHSHERESAKEFDISKKQRVATRLSAMPLTFFRFQARKTGAILHG